MDDIFRYGIDLGTSNSCIARWDGSDARVFQNNDLMNVTPSVVQVTRSNRILVGRKAMNQIRNDADNVAQEFKRQMGQKDRYHFPASGREMSPEELSSEVLKALRADAQRATGEAIDAAVVTVPAAFDTLQCEATATAARMAGLTETLLLQEPIAAAVAYGVTPDARDQRWIVLDLGGGTLDIAIVSTRDGRLNVLDHQGKNQFGGKDIDRLIVERFIIPALSEGFRIPTSSNDPKAFRRLYLACKDEAESAKIALSSSLIHEISLTGLGNDLDGREMWLETALAREDLELLVEPLVSQCIQFAMDAMEGAHVTADDIDRVLLVGGPTQIPLLREALRASICPRLDLSQDPMTVVARGAAIYGSGQERAETAMSIFNAPGCVLVKLAFERVSADIDCPVAGRLEDTKAGVLEVRIDAESGIWSSGWIRVKDGFFEVPVRLEENKEVGFRLTARDGSGRMIALEPSTFRIRHGLTPSDPPLPHTVSVEVVNSDCKPELDPVFKRGRSLPAEATVKYRAYKTLKPSDAGDSLAIKLWEGEVLEDPAANTWIANLGIAAEKIHRPIPAGAEIEVTIQMDTSRRITMEAYVPHLDKFFRDAVYMPEDAKQKYTDLAEESPEQIAALTERLEALEEKELSGEVDVPVEELERLRRMLEDVDVASNQIVGDKSDPDQARRVVDGVRAVRERLAKAEQAAGVNHEEIALVEQAQEEVAAAEDVVEQLGTPLEKRELGLLRQQVSRASQRRDERGLRKSIDGLRSLHWGLTMAQEWWWDGMLDCFGEPGRPFSNPTMARKWLHEGGEARQNGDREGVRESVRRLFELIPRNELAADQERVLHSGLKRY